MGYGMAKCTNGTLKWNKRGHKAVDTVFSADTICSSLVPQLLIQEIVRSTRLHGVDD